jgi:hypothetical protein
MSKSPADKISASVIRAALAFGVLVGVFVVVWGAGLLAGWPALPLSDKAGTERIFPVGESQTLTAITNAFEVFHYRQMMLTDAVGSDWMADDWHPTNGILLLPTLEPIASIPTRGLLGHRRLPYSATFHVTTSPAGTNQTKVNVRTVKACVRDGISLDPHGMGRGSIKVKSVRRVEEGILEAIANELSERK